MSQTNAVLAINDDLPIRTSKPVHSGKVRAVYWLDQADSQRLIEQRGYDVHPDSELAVMVISDRLSAFDCLWRAEGGMAGVPGKGAALNTIAHHWFKEFKAAGLAPSHILEAPHPLVWIVQKAQPIMIEAIARRYITGSMWRAYEKGERNFCGLQLPERLSANQRLPELLITPSTKGVLTGLAGVPEADDVNVSRAQIEQHFGAFGFSSPEDIATYEHLLVQGFELIAKATDKIGQLFVDTKFEFGYVLNRDGQRQIIYMDEVGTPDSSRLWDKSAYADGKVVENSKEFFRKQLLSTVPDPELLLDKNRMVERAQFAKATELPRDLFAKVSATYLDMAKDITRADITVSENPREEIIHALSNEFDLINPKP